MEQSRNGRANYVIWIRRSALWLALALGAVGSLQYGLPASVDSAPLIQFWVSNLEGERFDSRKQAGPYVISFFFVDCPPCLKEVPQLHAMMERQFSGTPLLFVDPIGEDSIAYVKEFADRVKVPYTFFYRDPLARMAKKLFKGRMVFPTIVGMRNGRELYRVHDLSPPSLKLIREGMVK